MKEHEIWRSGFQLMEGSGQACLLVVIEAETWEEAVELYREKRPGEIDKRQRKDGSTQYTDWGCCLYDNEKDARKTFG